MQETLPLVKKHNPKTNMKIHRIQCFLSFLIVLMIFCKHNGFGQDPHFSQFFVSPLTLNPAYTGKFDGSYRFSGNLKKQWPTINNAFTSSTAAIDFGILKNRIPEHDTWGIGFLALNDQSGNKILNNSYYTISTAYTKALDEDGKHQVTVGFQGSFVSKRLDLRRADLEDELTSLGFTGLTRESFAANPFSINYFDLNTGFMYALSTDGDNSFYVGASVYHLNRPSETFYGGSYLLNQRATIHGGAFLPLGGNKSFHISLMHQTQGAARETLAGGAFAFNLNGSYENPLELYTGGWYRLGDAIIPYIGLEVNRFRFGVTYDINQSTLRPASVSRGGTELSIIYTNGLRDPFKKKLNCPIF
jgi:type IX secretion system PorP/SprF family membrane protein